MESKLDINEHLIPRLSTTFMARATGDNMTGVSIFTGNVLVVDHSIQPKHGTIIVAVIDA